MEPAVATGTAGTGIVRVNQVVSDLDEPRRSSSPGTGIAPAGSSCSSNDFLAVPVFLPMIKEDLQNKQLQVKAFLNLRKSIAPQCF
jgi:hypothetical protein